MSHTKDLETSQAVAPHASVVSIRMLSGHFKAPKQSMKEVQIQQRISISSASQENRIFSNVEFGLRSQAENEDQNISVHGEFEVVFQVSSQDFDAESLQTFGRLNAAYIVWSYWREFVQSSTHRMGMSPILIPLMGAQDIAKMIRQTDDAHTNDSE